MFAQPECRLRRNPRVRIFHSAPVREFEINRPTRGGRLFGFFGRTLRFHISRIFRELFVHLDRVDCFGLTLSRHRHLSQFFQDGHALRHDISRRANALTKPPARPARLTEPALRPPTISKKYLHSPTSDPTGTTPPWEHQTAEMSALLDEAYNPARALFEPIFP